MALKEKIAIDRSTGKLEKFDGFDQVWEDLVIPPATLSGQPVNLSQLTQSGATGTRPTTLLVIGRQYFDTTLTKPIWWTGTVWVDATGTTV